MYLRDPMEQMEDRIERMIEEFVDERTCMICRTSVDYELVCMSPLGDGPMACADCAGVPEPL